MSLWPRLRGVAALLAEAARGWDKDNAPRLGAALAYYTLFSVAPLLVVAIAVAAVVFGQEAAQGRIVAQLSGLLGEAGARALEQTIESSRQSTAGTVASVGALVTLFLGATGVFGELKGALNVVWDVHDESQRPGFVVGILRNRLWSFAMVLGVGFLLLVSLLISAGLAAAQGALAPYLDNPGPLWPFVNALVSLALITVLFAMLFKFLPDTKVAWSDVWVGAAVTSVLFGAGKSLIGLYLGRSSVSSAYGAAGSLVVLILWVYYAAQIFFFGAELTQAYARRHGSRATSSERQPQSRRAPEPATA
ncbi:MAG TPA: YihY/virulence factor BrkB family protein [Vicinamibacteria bacterium]|nr:YihY/virulence factor BrkB family protein [Vicinamibacteria bacterium]